MNAASKKKAAHSTGRTNRSEAAKEAAATKRLRAVKVPGLLVVDAPAESAEEPASEGETTE